jgi:predicted phosphohydrolase
MHFMEICWLTDIHLNFIDFNTRIAFYEKILKTQCQAVIIAGDIAEAPTVCEQLVEIVEYIDQPIYFVLGNHDYYRGSIAALREQVRIFTQKYHLLRWLTDEDPAMLTETTALTGCDGWADGRYGDFEHSRVELNDSYYIAELYQAAVLGRQCLLKEMQKFAGVDADILSGQLHKAVSKQCKHIIIVTHIPPFEAACTYGDQVSSPDWMPLFSSKVLGDVIMGYAKQYPDINFLVLCGHTHSIGEYTPLDNLCVKTGGARYYYPEIQDVFVVE